jgi:hypothetical protein
VGPPTPCSVSAPPRRPLTILGPAVGVPPTGNRLIAPWPSRGDRPALSNVHPTHSTMDPRQTSRPLHPLQPIPAADPMALAHASWTPRPPQAPHLQPARSSLGSAASPRSLDPSGHTAH